MLKRKELEESKTVVGRSGCYVLYLNSKGINRPTTGEILSTEPEVTPASAARNVEWSRRCSIAFHRQWKETKSEDYTTRSTIDPLLSSWPFPVTLVQKSNNTYIIAIMQDR